MSETKRDNSAFHQTAIASRAMANACTDRAGLQATKAPTCAELQILDSWKSCAVPSGDPYNGIGARAITGRGLRK